MTLDSAGAVLGHSLGTLGDGMLGEFTGEEETDSSLNLAGSESLGVVVRSELGCLGGDALKEISNEGVHDAHGLGRDTSIRVNLFQDLVDVDGVRFAPLLLPGGFLDTGAGHTLLRNLLLRDRDALSFGGHDEKVWRVRRKQSLNVERVRET